MQIGFEFDTRINVSTLIWVTAVVSAAYWRLSSRMDVFQKLFNLLLDGKLKLPELEHQHAKGD